MILDNAPMQEGMSIPFVVKLTDDHQKLIVRVDVSEKDLPRGYDERKNALLLKAMEVVGAIGSSFDVDTTQYMDAVSVEFVTFEHLVKKDKRPYAEYVKGELIIH
jgi:rRNA processing protein Krr1/Pno1